jgi:hypothetical protein
MAEEKEGDRGFKVEDRRRFSPETGEAREQSGEERREDPSPRSGETTAAKEQGSSHSSGPLPEITFSSFILGLSTQALMYLGEIPSPQDKQPHQDLPAAQQMIDVLGVLRKKTVGNLDKNEEQLLDNILFDLRMKYVELIKKR